MSLGCFGYREDTSEMNSCETRSALEGRPCKVARNGLTTRGAQHIMEATEDWVGGPQLRHFLYGSRGRMRVSVY